VLVVRCKQGDGHHLVHGLVPRTFGGRPSLGIAPGLAVAALCWCSCWPKMILGPVCAQQQRLL
jgi:hypothetical protein